MASPGKKPFLLRIDPLLWAEVERLAAQELRSANAQVEYLLRDALRQRGRLGGTASQSVVDGSLPPDSGSTGPPIKPVSPSGGGPGAPPGSGAEP
jgi:hypothetical protein